MTEGLGWRTLPLIFGCLKLALGCGGDTDRDQGTKPDSGIPSSDAGLLPDAKIEDCLSDEGVHICGAKAGCYVAGADCDCAATANPMGPAGDAGVPDVGVCLNTLDGLNLRPCGTCYDGQVCARLYKDSPICVSESLGHLLWLHGEGERVLYADCTPYTGAALSEPVSCPASSGELVLCGGNCGGCGADRYCSGCSPTHPWGICVGFGVVQCEGGPTDCGADQTCLLLAAASAESSCFPPALCVSAPSCQDYASSVPGEAVCK